MEASPPHKKMRFTSAEIISTKERLEAEDKEICSPSPYIDPEAICPYCDTLLPVNPSAHLWDLLRITFPKSTRDARPTNPLGRKAPTIAFAAVCQRHILESNILPQARAEGWPTEIEWIGLEARIVKMKADLIRILADRGSPIVYNQGTRTTEKATDSAINGPRMRCVFWRELVVQLESSGLRQVTAAIGQFATFEKMQPGYYGELGSLIIHKCLYRLFPPDAVDADLVHPLSVLEFIGRILVPEVAMRLIAEDMSLDLKDVDDHKEAVRVLRASASYGVAMFPDCEMDLEEDEEDSESEEE
ncbi:RTC4-like domain-containing protein [Mycena galericulata]|nr:RTC4-like domain-containing protein [Mycena galericulata]